MLSDGIMVEFVSETIGYGLFTTRPFKKDETVWWEEGCELGRIKTWSEIQAIPGSARKVFCRWMDQILFRRRLLR